MEDIFEYTEDKEFEALIKDGLDASFDTEQLFVSDELIAKTLSRINAEPVQIKSASKKRFWRTASSIAAALLVGVVGIGFLAKGIGASKSADENAMVGGAKPSANRGFMAESVADTCAPAVSFSEASDAGADIEIWEEQKVGSSKDSDNSGMIFGDVSFSASAGSINEATTECEDDAALENDASMDSVIVNTEEFDYGKLPADWDAMPGLIIDNTIINSFIDNADSGNTDFSSDYAELYGRVLLNGEDKLLAVADYLDLLGGELVEYGTLNLPDYSVLVGKRPLAEVIVSLGERSLTFVSVRVYDDYYQYSFLPAYSSNSEDYLTELYSIENSEEAAHGLIALAEELAQEGEN